jgi:hypothetical protein
MARGLAAPPHGQAMVCDLAVLYLNQSCLILLVRGEAVDL